MEVGLAGGFYKLRALLDCIHIHLCMKVKRAKKGYIGFRVYMEDGKEN